MGGKHTYIQSKNGKWYYIDMSNTFDRGWEIMAFPADGDHGTSHGEGVTSWSEVYVDWPRHFELEKAWNKAIKIIENEEF